MFQNSGRRRFVSPIFTQNANFSEMRDVGFVTRVHNFELWVHAIRCEYMTLTCARHWHSKCQVSDRQPLVSGMYDVIMLSILPPRPARLVATVVAGVTSVWCPQKMVLFLNNPSIFCCPSVGKTTRNESFLRKNIKIFIIFKGFFKK